MDLPSGLILGLVYVAAPGPILVETLRQGARAGFIDALAVQAGSALGLIFYAGLALSGAGLLREATLQLAAGMAGMALLFYLGIATIRSGREPFLRAGARPLCGPATRRAFWYGMFLSLANPLDLVFWLSVGSRLLGEPGLEVSAFLSGFFLGGLAAALLAALFAGLWQSRLTARAALAVAWISGLALIGFGVRLGLSIGRELTGW